MQTHKVISITNARKKLSQIFNEIYSTEDTSYILTDRGKEKAVIMSHEDFESLIATIEVLSMPNIQERLAASRRDIEAGRVISQEEFMKKFGE